MTTPSQTAGPFFAIGLCRGDAHVLDDEGVELGGRLLDGRGDPIPDGLVEVYDAESGRWGRCGTDVEGRFRFLVPRSARRLEVLVFARGLLRHQLTRIYLDGAGAEHESLVALRAGDGFLFDIRMQGEQETAFFAL